MSRGSFARSTAEFGQCIWNLGLEESLRVRRSLDRFSITAICRMYMPVKRYQKGSVRLFCYFPTDAPQEFHTPQQFPQRGVLQITNSSWVPCQPEVFGEVCLGYSLDDPECGPL